MCLIPFVVVVGNVPQGDRKFWRSCVKDKKGGNLLERTRATLRSQQRDMAGDVPATQTTERIHPP